MDRNSILKDLRDTKSAQEWNSMCNSIKRWARTLPIEERSGQYPAWWYEDVVLSGLAQEVAQSWTSPQPLMTFTVEKGSE